MGVKVAPGPDNTANGSYEFLGNSSSYIEFPNSEGGALDVRHSMTMLCWLRHDGRDGPIFSYGISLRKGVVLQASNGRLIAYFRKKRLFDNTTAETQNSSRRLEVCWCIL